MSKKTANITITFEDDKDFKMEIALVKEKIVQYLKSQDPDLKEGGDTTAWSSHKYSVETQEE